MIKISTGLPNLSKVMDVAWLRYIQSIHGSLEHRNPDTLVRRFIPIQKRWRAAWMGREALSRLQSDPFYYFLLARTRYYDQLLQEAVSDGVRDIVLVGCGTDTRAYRFEPLLRSKGVRVLECDQAEVIGAKERLAKRWHHFDHVHYLPVDLNDGAWPQLQQWLGDRTGPKTLVMMEGVTVYVDATAFPRFLQLLAAELAPGSQVAYDFKIRGANDQLGRGGRTATPFRLPAVRDEVEAFHAARGLRLEHMELSTELSARFAPRQGDVSAPLFGEDVLVRTRIADSSNMASSRVRRIVEVRSP
jgi:methyltransferase (TIGR00027 family)